MDTEQKLASLLQAASAGDLAAVQTILESSAGELEVDSYDESTALISAAYEGKLEVASVVHAPSGGVVCVDANAVCGSGEQREKTCHMSPYAHRHRS